MGALGLEASEHLEVQLAPKPNAVKASKFALFAVKARARARARVRGRERARVRPRPRERAKKLERDMEKESERRLALG